MATESLQLFAFDDDYAFGIIQSDAHWEWARAQGSKIEERTRYTHEVWTTFPWPQEIGASEVARVAAAARELRATRDQLMDANGWSLRDLHRAAEVEGPHPLKDAQHTLDEAVAGAYGMPADRTSRSSSSTSTAASSKTKPKGRRSPGLGFPCASTQRIGAGTATTASNLPR